MNDRIPADLLYDSGEIDPKFHELPDIDHQTYLYIVKVLDFIIPNEMDYIRNGHIGMLSGTVMVDRKRKYKKLLLKKVTLFPNKNEGKNQ